MDLQYREISCQKANTLKDFGSGVQDYNFSIGGASLWHPKKSYFKITMRVTAPGGINGAGDPPTSDKEVALADNVVGNLFDNVYFRGGGQDISNIVSYAPQASMLRQRLTKSGAWLNSMGKDVYGLDADYTSRVNKISKDTTYEEDKSDRINLGAEGNEFDYTITLNANGTFVGVNTDFDGSVGGRPVAERIPKLVAGDILVYNNQRVKVLTVVDATNGTYEPSLDAIPPQSLPFSRVAMGFDAAGGSGTDRNAATYDDTTGVITFTRNGGAALPLLPFAVGDYFAYTAIDGVGPDDPRLNVQAKVLAIDALAQTITVELGVIGADVLEDGRTDFVKTTVRAADPITTTNAYGVRGSASGKKYIYTYLWKPPIGIFDSDKALGSGDMRISLNPNARYKTSAIESIANLVASETAAANSFNFEITDLKFYIALTKDTVQLSGVESLFLHEQHLVSKPITGLTNSLDFSVPPSTKMLVFFIQSGKAGSDTRIPPSKFKALEGRDMSVESFQLTYANRSRPSTRWTSAFDTTQNTMQQRFWDTFTESGLAELQGGTETMADWINRGPVYAYRFDRDSSDKSTRVQLQLKVKDYEEGSNVILCSFYTRTVEIAYQNGMITDVVSLNV